jgi:gamma-glutamylcyclotransferase (GGCT)/AIG2-like uncharacterized protein YtfP
MCSDIMQQVSGQTAQYDSANLKGFYRSQLQAETYPAIVPQVGDQVEGRIYFDIGTTAIHKLDAFEGEYYSRQTVEVVCDSRGMIEAMVYIIKPQYYHLLTRTPWNFEDFLHNGKQRFLNQYVGFGKI